VQADAALKPFFYGIDVSSGIETNGFKDSLKMEKFMNVIRYG
jgi:phosphoribosylanthranilate isomerase